MTERGLIEDQANACWARRDRDRVAPAWLRRDDERGLEQLREECRQDLVQQEPEPADHAAKVVVGRGKDGVGGVAATEPEVVAIHAVLGFEMADNGFDGGPAAQFALDVGRHRRFWPKMKTLKGLTPYEFICKYWTSEPERLTLNPLHQMPGLNSPLMAVGGLR